ncbi:MAG: family 10 glycosylhydrolase [Planctomycetota bacterium]
MLSTLALSPWLLAIFPLILLAAVPAFAASQPSPPRRLIYNDDGGALKHIKGPSLETYFSERLADLPNTPVTTVFFCPHDDWASAFYDSRIEGVQFSGSGPLRKLMDSGTDPIQATIDFCRSHNLEIYCSFRMNDIHDSYSGAIGPLKRDHPDWLLGSKDANYPPTPKGNRTLKGGTWSSLNYSLPEVRSHIQRSIEEAITRWNWDGVEFDYGRNASLFPSVFAGRPATDSERDTLTDFQRSLRSLIDARSTGSLLPPSQSRIPQSAIRTPHSSSLPLAVVVPETVALCRYVGIDIERWLDEKLIDIVIAGNGYVPFSPAAYELIPLARRAGVPIYIRINANTGGAGRPYWNHVEAWRAYAGNVFASGADGIYLFNTYDAKLFSDRGPGIFHEIGDPSRVAFHDRLYLADWNLAEWGYGFGDVAFYAPHDHMLPMSLADADAFVEFACFEDLKEASRPPREILLRLSVRDLSPDASCSFRLNDSPLLVPWKETRADVSVFEYLLSPRHLRVGANRISASYEPPTAPASPPALVSVELWIRPAGSPGR